jgi:hypothetical protein
MTSPIGEPPGLGVGLDTIRRWEHRGLIVTSERPARIDRPMLIASQHTVVQRSSRFPPLLEQWLPVVTVEPVDERPRYVRRHSDLLGARSRRR